MVDMSMSPAAASMVVGGVKKEYKPIPSIVVYQMP